MKKHGRIGFTSKQRTCLRCPRSTSYILDRWWMNKQRRPFVGIRGVELDHERLQHLIQDQTGNRSQTITR